MWLTTLDGMYSIVDKAIEGPEYLCVRSRDEDSLIRMRNRIIDSAKSNDESVYVKTGPNDGVMCQGQFWTGRRLQDAGTDYEWRMSVPHELISVWMGLILAEVTYNNFKDECYNDWSERCDPSVTHKRMNALTEVWYVMDRLWPRAPSQHPSLKQKRPVLQMLQGGGDNGSDASGV